MTWVFSAFVTFVTATAGAYLGTHLYIRRHRRQVEDVKARARGTLS